MSDNERTRTGGAGEAVEWSERAQAYQVEHDPEEGRLSTTVVFAVASLENRAAEEMEPLADSVDPEALDRLFAPVGGSERASGSVTFPFAGYAVTVSADGTVSLEPRTSTDV
jgi:hypothetical protein